MRERYYKRLSGNCLKPLKVKVFNAEYGIIFALALATTLMLRGIVRLVVHILNQLIKTKHFFKGFIPPPFILAFFREVFRPAGITLGCLFVFTVIAIFRHFGFRVFYLVVRVNQIALTVFPLCINGKVFVTNSPLKPYAGSKLVVVLYDCIAVGLSCYVRNKRSKSPVIPYPRSFTDNRKFSKLTQIILQDFTVKV